MGTRGCYGFYKNGQTKVTYNHFDSYPEYLGKSIIEFLKNTSIEELNEIFEKIIMVKQDSKPTKKQITQLKKYADLRVSSQSLDEWYVLLRNIQGDLNPYKKDLVYMIDSQDFLTDSLFCEWAYIINLDINELEIYKGFNKIKTNQAKRYKISKPDDQGYYSISPFLTFTFDEINKLSLEEILGYIEKLRKQLDKKNFGDQMLGLMK